jgi:tetratricopeptide (TPR) repeat protein
VLEHRRVALETTDTLLLDAQADRATALVALGRYDDALADLAEVLPRWASLQPRDHPRVVQGRQHQVICYVNLGRPDDALVEIDEILTATAGSWPADDPMLGQLREVRAQLQSTATPPHTIA